MGTTCGFQQFGNLRRQATTRAGLCHHQLIDVAAVNFLPGRMKSLTPPERALVIFGLALIAAGVFWYLV